MRKLQTSDLFSAMRLVSKIDLKRDLQEIYRRSQEAHMSQREAGLEVFYILLSKAAEEKTEALVYEFLADIFEVKPESIRTMPPTEMFEKVFEAAGPAEWMDFFGKVRRLTAQKS